MTRLLVRWVVGVLTLVLSFTSAAQTQCVGPNPEVWSSCFGYLEYPNGDSYAGDFLNGKFHGLGTYTKKNGGQAFTGRFVDGEGVDGVDESGQPASLRLIGNKEVAIKRLTSTTTQAARGQGARDVENLVERVTPEETSVKINSTAADLMILDRLRNPDAFRISSAQDLFSISGGSAFVVSSEGHLLTNHHVVTDVQLGRTRTCDALTFEVEGQKVVARVLGFDDRYLGNDIALIKADFQPGVVFPFRETNPRLGEPIFSLGFPVLDEVNARMKVSAGVVGSEVGNRNNSSQFLFDAIIHGGSSGGPVIDAEGFVVGQVAHRANDGEGKEVLGANGGANALTLANFMRAHDVEPMRDVYGFTDSVQMVKTYERSVFLLKCWLAKSYLVEVIAAQEENK